METSKKVNYLYDLQDAGYDAKIIREFSQQKGHRPIIDINPKNSKELREKIQLQEDEKKKFEFLGYLSLQIHITTTKEVRKNCYEIKPKP